MEMIIWIGVGAGFGALMGYFGRCSSGNCPLTSTWWRSALYGALLGGAFYYVSGRNGSAALNQSTRNVKVIEENQFESEVVQSVSPVVVDFYAPWCGPCKALSPILDEMAGTLTNRLKFVKINIDQAPGLAQRFQIEGVPTLVFLNKGRATDKLVGLPSPEVLKVRLESFASLSTIRN